MTWRDTDPKVKEPSGGILRVWALGEYCDSVIEYLVKPWPNADWWEPTKYTEAGKFKNRLLANKYHETCTDGYLICVEVPQGGWPQWYLLKDNDYNIYW